MHPNIFSALAPIRRLVKERHCRISIEMNDTSDVITVCATVPGTWGHRILAEAPSYEGGPTIEEAVENLAAMLEHASR